MSTKNQSLALVTTLFGCLSAAACGSGGSSADANIIIFIDASTNGDGGIVAECNPVVNTGCGPNEKCSKLNQTDTLARTTCVPDGTVERGGACEWGEPGATTGYDNCLATNYCRNGICREICDSAPDSCSSGNCVQIYNTFDETDGVGVCAESCDPVSQDCSADGEGCYLNTTSGKSSCSAVPEEAVGLGQDANCHGPTTDSCYLNGCDEGFAPILNRTPGASDGSICTQFCSPAITTVADASAPRGNDPYTCGNLAYQCRFIQSFYSNTPMVDASIGFCVDPTLWGDCTLYDPADEKTFAPGCEPLAAASKRPAGVALPKFTGDLRLLNNLSLPKR